MRKGVFSWELSRRRLLPLLLVITLSIIGAHTVHGSSGTKPDFVIRKDSPALQNSDGVSNQGQYQLFNRCSNRFVQIVKGGRKGRVNSRGRKNNNSTHFVFESYSGGYIYIRGLHRKRYICFNKYGKLILRHNEAPTCLFKQIENSKYYSLQSRANVNWYIGFGKNGKRLKGWVKQKRRRKEKCFHFVMMKVRKPIRYSPMNGTDRDKLKQFFKTKS